jgi:hypothetical protein
MFDSNLVQNDLIYQTCGNTLSFVSMNLDEIYYNVKGHSLINVHRIHYKCTIGLP